MDDHSEAFLCWREAGLKGLTCLHLDAHLDVADETLAPSTLASLVDCPPHELHRFRSSPERPWSGLHCGNFLYPALHDGTVGHLIWVVPEWLPDPDLLAWLRTELHLWLDVQLEDYASLRAANGRVEGRLCGRRLTVCTLERLPPLGAPLAIDIDVDYFIGLEDDRLWQSPAVVANRLSLYRPDVVTVATSVRGGYTPADKAHLGTFLALQLTGRELPDPTPEATRADLAARWLARNQPAEAMELLEPPCTLNERYLRSLALSRLERHYEAGEELASLLGEALSPLERARLLALLGESQMETGSYSKSIESFEQVLELEPERGEILFRLGISCWHDGQPDRAEEALQRALALLEDRYSSLDVHEQLSRLYQVTGQPQEARRQQRLLEEKRYSIER